MWAPRIWYGGAIGAAISADYDLVDRKVRVFSFLPASTGLKVVLPDATLLSKGADLYVIVNEHATRTLVIVDHDGTTVASLVGPQGAKLHLESNATAAGTWRARVTAY